MLAVTVVASTVLCAAGCSLLGGTAKTAATAATGTGTSTASATPSSYSPLAGPIEAASALPKQCSRMLDTAQLQAVFGAGLPIGDDYASYAALPGIGRTGRVVCAFGVGLDSFGRQSAGAIEVAMATYTSATAAAGRAADTVQSDSRAGATTSTVSVGGHPATIVVEQGAAGASSSATSATSATSAISATSSSPATSAAAAAPGTSTASQNTSSPLSPTAGGSGSGSGETELVMADGNRTFVLQIPFAKLSAQPAMTALTRLALEVYRNTLPAAASSAKPSSSTR
jgi:hypothetical protein